MYPKHILPSSFVFDDYIGLRDSSGMLILCVSLVEQLQAAHSDHCFMVQNLAESIVLRPRKNQILSSPEDE